MQGKHIGVIGAGMVGLATAWHLRRRGAEVTVLDRTGPAAGSSWGNAGWLSPALAVPLAEPSVFQQGLRSLVDADSPLYIPIPPDARALKFFMQFSKYCTIDQWHATMARYIPLNRRALAAFDTLADAFPAADPTDPTAASATVEAPIWAAFRRPEDAADLEREFALIRQSGLELETREVGPGELRGQFGFLTEEVTLGVRIDGQRHLDPARYVAALAEGVAAQGVTIRCGEEVAKVRRKGGQVLCWLRSGEAAEFDEVVVANGSWLPHLARDHGVRTTLVAGRGYSFQVDVPTPPVPAPLYLPAQRVACTPVGDRLRVAGTMEFRPTEAPLDPRRVQAIINSVRPLMGDIDFEARTDEWVGPRPVTADSLPLIGPTRTEGVWVAGGHGMWGITQGPITAELLAEWMDTGTPDPALAAFDPLR